MSYLWNPDYDGITQMYLHIRILMILQVGPTEQKKTKKIQKPKKIQKSKKIKI